MFSCSLLGGWKSLITDPTEEEARWGGEPVGLTGVPAEAVSFASSSVNDGPVLQQPPTWRGHVTVLAKGLRPEVTRHFRPKEVRSPCAFPITSASPRAERGGDQGPGGQPIRLMKTSASRMSARSRPPYQSRMDCDRSEK